MNINMLTKILQELNEADDKITNAVIKGVQNFNNQVDDHIANLKNAPKKRGRVAADQNPANIEKQKNEFLTKVANATRMETERLTGSTSETKGYRKEFMERITRFLAGEKSGSYANDIVIVRDIVSAASDEDIKGILNIPNGKGNLKPIQRKINGTSRINIFSGINPQLAKRLADFAPGTCGRFEMLLGILYNGTKVSGREGYKSKGDVQLCGDVYEVKKSGTGGVDTGWKQFQHLLNTTVDKNKKMELQRQIKELKQQEAAQLNVLMKSINKFVKNTFNNIINTQNEGSYTNDVQDFAENYFALLSDDDKKRAILYGFSNIGYKNIIVCEDNGETQIVTEESIMKFVHGNGSITELGIDIGIPNTLNNKNSKPKTADFQKINIRLA